MLSQKCQHLAMFVTSMWHTLHGCTYFGMLKRRDPYFCYGIKGALDNFSLIPRFFFQKSWDFYTIRSVYLCSDCMLNLTCNFNLITKICEFFLAAAIFKSLLLKMAATVMTFEFGTIHHYSRMQESSEACLCSSLNRYKK